ncbi:hypothetical protein JCM10207_003802 [Rhodosporidiobolus poonsookiae]
MTRLMHHAYPSDSPHDPRPPFRKVLYLRQPYPDNHVDRSFLSHLQRNLNVHPATLPALLRQTLPITQHLAATLLFLALFIHLSAGSISPYALLGLSGVLAVVFRLWGAFSSPSQSPSQSPSARGGPGGVGLRGTIPLAALYLLSPALKTLTKPTTSDSIWALAGALFALNLAVGDYRAVPFPSPTPPPPPSSATSTSPAPPSSSAAPAPPLPRARPLPAPAQTNTTSLTAALSGSTVLASRLPTNTSVFALLLLSTLWFGPFPLLRSSLALRPSLLLTVLLSACALITLRTATTGSGAVGLAAASLAGTSIAAPLVRGWLAVRYKERMSGPWDAAVMRLGRGGLGEVEGVGEVGGEG